MLPVAAEITGFALITCNNKLEARAGPQMPPYLEQHDVVEIIALLATGLPQIAQLPRVGTIGQKAAAPRRLGVVGEPERRRQLDLRTPTTTRKATEFAPVHPALGFRQGRRQQLRAERPQ